MNTYQARDNKKQLTTFTLFSTHPADCDKTHRSPQGPNEDIAVCFHCGTPTYGRRNSNETFGHHLSDCSLPRDHLSFCKPGGKGHPQAKIIRG